MLAARSLFDHEPDIDATRQFLAEPTHHLLVAYDPAGEPVGFVSGVEMTHPAKGTEMFLYELGVGEPARRQGIGRSLVEALAKGARLLRHVDGHGHRQRCSARNLRTSRGPDEPTPADGRMGLRRRGPTTQPIATVAFAEGAISAERSARSPFDSVGCLLPSPSRSRVATGSLAGGGPRRWVPRARPAARAWGRPGAPRWVLSTPSRTPEVSRGNEVDTPLDSKHRPASHDRSDRPQRSFPMRAIARGLRLAGARPVIVGVVRAGGRGSAATVDVAPVADGDHGTSFSASWIS